MIEQQQKLVLSPYMEIYELVIPKDNLLRQIKELVDFSFIYDELLANYCLDNGRNAVPPIRMFKYPLQSLVRQRRSSVRYGSGLRSIARCYP